MTIIQAVILGIVEGVTEFLPISSTGHLILAGKVLGIGDAEFTKSFDIAIQLGAVLAVVVLYWRRFFTDAQAWKKVLLAFLPTAIIGFVFYKIIKHYFLSNSLLVVWSLLLGGIVLIAIELWHKKKSSPGVDAITHRQAFFTGAIQAISAIPGVSRSGATIVGGLLMGISRKTIVEFSFLLAIPTMAAATGYDLLKSGASFSGNDVYLLAIGFVVSFFVALAAVKWLLDYIQSHTFIAFGVYRILVALIFLFLVVR